MSKNEVCKSAKDSGYNDWEVKNALDTLKRAEELKKDKKMMKLVSTELKKQQEALKQTKLDIDTILSMSDEELSKKLK